jgi:hypothetical protein
MDTTKIVCKRYKQMYKMAAAKLEMVKIKSRNFPLFPMKSLEIFAELLGNDWPLWLLMNPCWFHFENPFYFNPPSPPKCITRYMNGPLFNQLCLILL